MSNYLKEFFKFLKGIFSTGTPESGKRFFGAIGFISSIIIIFIWRKDLTETLLFTSAALLGMETLTSIFNKR